MKRPIQMVFLGENTVIHPDEIYPDDHALVKALPELFADVHVVGDAPVEQATKAPGEKRTTRRP